MSVHSAWLSARKSFKARYQYVVRHIYLSDETTHTLLQNGRDFDYLDIVGNVLGSLAGLGICSIYHKRMLERKRVARGYRSVSGDEEAGDAGIDDVELEEGTSAQETGIAPVAPATLEEDIDNWDENAEDWSDDEPTTNGAAPAKTPIEAPTKKD